MTAPPALLRPFPPASARGAGPLGWVLGGAATLTATAVAGMLALLFAAAVAVAALLAFAVVLLALAAAKARGARARGPSVITARWTGCGWDAAG